MPRLALLLLALLAFASPAQAGVKPVKGSAPQDLRGFLLRADEPRSDVFPRTPSFAWRPVSGAVRYEFELSTSSVFREGGIIYSAPDLKSPAASIPLSLPWITGNPYSLYARVRAILQRTATPWTPAYGFNMRWPTIPEPLTTYPGLLRWTPVAGATRYDIWLVDTRKIFSVNTNVADQREYYTFHQSTTWTSSVRWKVRAVRTLFGSRKNNLPAVSYGPWSPTYTAVNPPFAVGPLNGVATVSDVVSDWNAATSHRLMPGFVFTGNQVSPLAATELYRVYVFTDRDCINVVFRGAIVGGPAYAPRPLGPLALPHNDAAIAKARNSYLKDGSEGAAFTADGVRVTATEAEVPAQSGGESGATGTGSPAAGSGTSVPVDQTKVGAPVDLWDTDWPQGGYYWTVVPVAAVPPDPFSTTMQNGAAIDDTMIVVSSAAELAPGDSLTIGTPSNQDKTSIVKVTGSTIELSAPLKFAHAPGEPVDRTAGDLEYRDLELTQEACAAGRVMRFGKSSEPAMTIAGAPFASGLSPTGRLISATQRSAEFYGPPIVAWGPALGASSYDAQWSKTEYPFQPETAEKDVVGIQTFATSATLPLKPGTWYYRVRGINPSLPGGAQAMSWSDSVKLVVARPKFAIVKR
ncbi:MAG: hypothetical protein ACRDNX_05270 [Gaiellaceae bacterium]